MVYLKKFTNFLNNLRNFSDFFSDPLIDNIIHTLPNDQPKRYCHGSNGINPTMKHLFSSRFLFRINVMKIIKKENDTKNRETKIKQSCCMT